MLSVTVKGKNVLIPYNEVIYMRETPSGTAISVVGGAGKWIDVPESFASLVGGPACFVAATAQGVNYAVNPANVYRVYGPVTTIAFRQVMPPLTVDESYATIAARFLACASSGGGGSAADGSETKVNAGSNVTVTGTGTIADPYVIAAAGGGSADGSETKVNAGANITVTGTGTVADPYVITGQAGGGGGSTFVRDSLTSGQVSVESDRLGGAATVLTNPAPGEYNLAVQPGAHIGPTTVTGNNATLNANQEMIIRVDNSANSNDRRFLVQLYDNGNGSLVDQQITGTVHRQTVAGNVTSILIPGLNGFGANGFTVEIR